MRANKFSRTAVVVAAIRALAYIEGDTHVLPDRYALSFITPIWRFIVKHRFFRWLVFRKLNGSLSHGIVCTVLGRSQYTEDRVDELLKKSLKQFVILGAGLDSYVYRRTDVANKLTVFEVDHPATQKFKLETMRRLRIPRPKNLQYLPCDFENDSIREVLLGSSYSPKKKTVFGWLGIIHYLSEPSIEQVLAELAASAPVGSELVFDYYDETIFSKNPHPDARKVMRAAARRGEVMVSGHTPDSLKKLLKKQGWELQEVLSPADQEKVFFSKPASYACKPFPFSWLARATLKKSTVKRNKKSILGRLAAR